jgi:hypothetical protein
MTGNVTARGGLNDIDAIFMSMSIQMEVEYGQARLGLVVETLVVEVLESH